MQRILNSNDPELMLKAVSILMNSEDEELIELAKCIKERALLIGIKHINHIVDHFPFLT